MMNGEDRRYGEGQEPDDCVPGDFILTHRSRPFAALISQAQKRRFRGHDAVYAHWTHAAFVVGKDGAIVEAEAMGVKRSPIAKYRDNEYHLVRLGEGFAKPDRDRAAAYANQQVGQAFGFLNMFGAALYLLFGVPLRLMRGDHQVCSGLVVRALQAGGQMLDMDPDLTLPADLAKRFDVKP